MYETLGVIAPHPPIMLDSIGGERSEATRGSVAALLTARDALRRFAPDAIVLSSPHAPLVGDAFAVRTSHTLQGDFSAFGAASTTWAGSGDPVLANEILLGCEDAGVPAVDLADAVGDIGVDHGLTVPMWFLDPEGTIPLIEVSLAHLSLGAHEDFGRSIVAAARATGRRVAFIASGDLSHRLSPQAPAGYEQRAHEFDELVIAAIRERDLGALQELDPSLVALAGECGLRSLVILAGFLHDTQTDTRVLHYEAPWGVGYLTALVGSPSLVDLDPDVSEPADSLETDEHSPHVILARHAIEEYLRTGRTISPSDTAALDAPSAAFVSLHRHGELRGCIGTTEPTRTTLADEIVDMAIHAATQDPRFPALGVPELDDLEISVDVLHPPESIDDASLLDAKRYGVIVHAGWRRGLLLPDLEGIDTPEEQIAIARRKAGIGPDEPVSLERFRVERFH